MARILVVDDEPDAVEFVKAVLEEAGHEVASAVSAESGLEAARSAPPDVMILDVQMPGKDGFAAFAEMQQCDTLKAIPVVMLTGVGATTGLSFSGEAMGQFYGAEPAAYLEKPIDPEALQKTVNDVLGA